MTENISYLLDFSKGRCSDCRFDKHKESPQNSSMLRVAIPEKFPIKPLEWIVGKWISYEAKGEFPTIKAFQYNETVEFKFIGQPVINFSSITFEPLTGSPKHLEEGFLRIKPGTNAVALINSHVSGISVIEEGTVLDKELNLETTSVHRMSFARPPFVTKYRRKYYLDGDVLNYDLWMETENTPMSRHLSVKYRR